MRMWMCDPIIMCQKHLCGEHVETHMFYGTIKKLKSISGYIKNNLFEPRSLFERHNDLSYEMIRRGMNHKSEIGNIDINDFKYLNIEEYLYEIDKDSALEDLISRCPECNRKHKALYIDYDKEFFFKEILKLSTKDEIIKCINDPIFIRDFSSNIKCWFDPTQLKNEIEYYIKFCNEQIEVWWDPEIFDWENYTKDLCIHCFKQFEVWWDPERFNLNENAKYLYEYCSEYKNIWEPYYLLQKIL